MDPKIATAGVYQPTTLLTVDSLLKGYLSGTCAWLPQGLMTLLLIKPHQIKDASYCNCTITLCNTKIKLLNTTNKSMTW